MHKRKEKAMPPKACPEPTPRSFSRRGFMKAGLLVGADAVLETQGCGVVSLLMRSMAREQEWRFLEKPYKIEEIGVNWRFLDKNCVPWSERNKVWSARVLKELQKLVPRLSEYLRSQGKNPADYQLLPIEQNYGLPSKDGDAAQDVLEFCKKAMDYLYSRLPQLVRTQFKYTIMEPGKDYSHANQTIFIGDRAYVMYRLYSHRKEMEIDDIGPLEKVPPFAVTAGTSVGCKASLTHVPGDFSKVLQFNIFISNSPYALLGIPSEIIPMTTMRASMRHFSASGADEAVLADETITEGISTLLVREMVDEFQIPNGHQLMGEVRRYMNSNSPIYGNVQKSVRWLEKNGIENGLELYMENPRKFLRLIQDA